MGRSDYSRKNILTGLISRIGILALTFLERTVLIYTLGIEYTGLFNLFTSVLTLLGFADLGIGTALTYYMYKPIAQQNDEKVRAIVALFRKSYIIIGFVTFAIGLGCLPFLPYLVKDNTATDINLYVLFMIYLFRAASNLMYGTYNIGILTATQRLDIYNNIMIVVNIVGKSLEVLILLFLRNYYLYILILPITTLTINGLCIRASKREFPQYYPEGKLEKSDITEIKRKVGGVVFQKLGTLVIYYTDSIIISIFLGIKVLGIYGGYNYIITALYTIVTMVITSITPSIGNSVVLESREKNLRDLKKFQFLYAWIVGWCFVCLLCLFQPFIALWQGEENIFSNGVMVALCFSFYFSKIGELVWGYSDATGLWWETKFVLLLSAIAKLAIMIITARFWGIYGVVLSTIATFIFVNIPMSSYIVIKKHFGTTKDWIMYLIKNVFYLVITLAASALTYWITTFVPFRGIVQLAVNLIICCFVPNVIFLLCFFPTKDFKNALDFVLNHLPFRK